ncbi:GcrA family cell cycle regulator [Moorella sp. Hama-1]|uniref:GcrA family cell cycle regulator n=1 Tax=Moorella sp. Hama-1 TaxID=2138101 RepID=UPI00137946E0|nr:GcrA family cell cycle regulator [Moorella sp. Hama-1]BCV20427.1 hypothetical protein hamaS1_04960 [Moorella sp. Hama-1]
MLEQRYIGVVCPSGNVKNLGGRPLLIDLEKLKELHAAGMTDAEIASELGVKRNTIAMARKRLGLTANRKVGEHGGTTQRSSNEEEAALVAWMQYQQAVNAAEMSARKVQVGGGDWLRWAGSAYELDGNRNKYICTLDPTSRPADLPLRISAMGNFPAASGFKKGKGGGKNPLPINMPG